MAPQRNSNTEILCILLVPRADDPVTGYARRQRERIVSILSERAARERVHSLLTGQWRVFASVVPSGPARELQLFNIVRSQTCSVQ